ncbi:MAG: winged helix DNA-binding protein [Cyclobacteriaceae bacterium]|nr:winged helix DNA-binding protein [Cyclobacteriaceae bacterium]
MPLEQDIQQREFRNEHHKAILNILYTHNYLVGKINDLFKDFEVTRQQYNVLRILRGQYPGHASINIIRERMLDNMSDASRIVERLRLKELVKREDSKDDKRAVEITITEKGLQLLNSMQHDVDSLDTMLQGLTADEALQLNKLLDKIRTSEPIRESQPFELKEVSS